MNLSARKQHFFLRKVASGISIVIFVILLLNFFQSQVRNSFYFVSYPITNVLWKGGDLFSGFFQSLFFFSSIKEENALLQKKNEELLSRITFLQEVLAQDKASKIAESMAEEHTLALIAAQTIGLDSSQDTIIINRGGQDGVRESMAVISAQRVLYGKVAKVYSDFSEVMLISSQKSTINVKIQRDNLQEIPTYGAVKGKGYFAAYLDLVPSNVELHTGDVLVTSALEGIFPKGLLVGTVVKNTQDDVKPFQTAEIQPFFDTKEIENLFIITDYPKIGQGS